MKTEQRLQNGIKELAYVNSLDEITVISLCTYLGIKRQTFYYHYKDIYDLIDSMFVNKSHELISNKEEIDENLIKYIEKDYKFLNIIAKSNASDLLKDFFYDITYYQRFNDLSEYNFSNEKKGIITRMIANSLSNELVYQIGKHEEFNKNNLLNLIQFFNKLFIESVKN